MKRIRIKKEIALVWAVTINGHEEALAGKDLSLFLIDPKYKKTAKTFTIQNTNEVKFRVLPAEQTYTGVYTLELWANYGKTDQSVVDRRSAFELVQYTPLEDDGLVDDIHAAEVYIGSGNLAVGIHGRGIVKTEKVSTDPNDPNYKIFYDDGTYDTITIARGEKGLTDAEHAAVIAQTTAAQTAAAAATSAASNANTKAALADTKAALADEKATAANTAAAAATTAKNEAQSATSAAQSATTAANNAATSASNAAATANAKAEEARTAALNASNAATSANNAATAANAAKTAAETATTNANNAASLASTKATAANTAASAANTAASSANSAASSATSAATSATTAAEAANTAAAGIDAKIATKADASQVASLSSQIDYLDRYDEYGSWVLSTKGYISPINGNKITAEVDYSFTDYINVKDCRKIVLTLFGSTSATRFGSAFYDENKTFLSGVTKPSQSQVGEIVVPEGACYFRTSHLTEDETFFIKVYHNVQPELADKCLQKVYSAQMLDKSAFLKNVQVVNSGSADINSVREVSGWTALNPIYFADGRPKKFAVNMNTNFHMIFYVVDGGSYLRSGNIAPSSWTAVGDHYEYELTNNNIRAVRCHVATANLAEEPKMTLAEEWEGSSAEFVKTRYEVKPEAIAPWSGKKICGIGDSIMIGCYDSGSNKGSAILDGTGSYGMMLNSTGGFLGALREKYPSIDVLNMGVGSTTMAKNDSIAVNQTYKCITERIDNIPDGYDYILLGGGCNDYFHKDAYNVPYGTESNVEYLPLLASYDATSGYSTMYKRLYPYSGSGNQDLDITTFCGAMEIALIKLLVRFHDKKIGYIIWHSIRPLNEYNVYMDYAKKLCKKYGIPCLDLREVAAMPRVLAVAGNNSGSLYTIDAVHPNRLGYKEKYLPAVEAWLRTL